MFKIEITDPHKEDPAIIRRIAKLLLGLVGDEMVDSRDSMAATLNEVSNTLKNIIAAPTENTETVEWSGTVYASGDLDTNGLPWDKRIHSRTMSKNPDGTWKLQRGIEMGIVHKVEAELRKAKPRPVSAPVVALVPASLAASVVEAPPAPVAVAIPDIAMPPAPVAVPSPPNDEPDQNPEFSAAPGYEEFMTLLTKAIGSCILNHKDILDIVRPYGIPDIPSVARFPDMIPAIYNDVNARLN